LKTLNRNGYSDIIIGMKSIEKMFSIENHCQNLYTIVLVKVYPSEREIITMTGNFNLTYFKRNKLIRKRFDNLNNINHFIKKHRLFQFTLNGAYYISVGGAY